MTIAKRGGSFEATINHRGGRYRRSFPDKHAARVWEAETQAQLLKGEDPDMGARARVEDGKPTTMQALYDYVWKHHWASQRAASTHAINGTQVVQILGGHLPIAKVDVFSIDKLSSKLKGTGNGPATINRKLAALSKMLTVAVELEVIPRKPKIRKLKEDKGRSFRFTDELEARALRFFESIGNALMVSYVTVALDTGMRQGECLSLAWKSVDGRFVRLDGTDCKSGKPRSIPLTPRASAAFESLRSGHRTSRVFEGLTRPAIRHYWGRLADHLGLEDEPCFVPHIMRHEFCSRLADRGLAAPLIQALAGHSSLIVTQRYINLSPVALEDAIEALAKSYVRLPVASGRPATCHAPEVITLHQDRNIGNPGVSVKNSNFN